MKKASCYCNKVLSDVDTEKDCKACYSGGKPSEEFVIAVTDVKIEYINCKVCNSVLFL